MKKIPTLFVRKFENHKIAEITDEITPGCEEAFRVGVATVKYDGACCMMLGGELYKRYDAKNGKIPPEGAIPCDKPDPITGHWPHWVKIDINNPKPDEKWFVGALVWTKLMHGRVSDGTYEAIGLHFNGNPYNLSHDELMPHGRTPVYELSYDNKRTFESIRDYLRDHEIEGIVFWDNDQPVCKIKRTDFGFEWPIKKGDI
jgi:hypothetical protein